MVGGNVFSVNVFYMIILLVLFAVVRQYEILKLNFHFDPLFIRQSWPDVMGLSDGGFVRLENNLGSVIVDMKCSQDEDKPGESLAGGRDIGTLVFEETDRYY